MVLVAGAVAGVRAMVLVLVVVTLHPRRRRGKEWCSSADLVQKVDVVQKLYPPAPVVPAGRKGYEVGYDAGWRSSVPTLCSLCTHSHQPRASLKDTGVVVGS